MPIQQALSPDQIQYLISQGVDPKNIPDVAEITTPDEIAAQQTSDPQSMSSGRAVMSTLKARAGGILGSSGAIPGALAGAAIGSAFPVVGTTIGGIVGGVAGGLGGSYGGQKIQESVESPETRASLEEQLAQAQAEHPYVTGGTEIAAGALASGGLPTNPMNILKGGRAVLGKLGMATAEKGDSALLGQVIKQAAINPAIDIGQSLATGNGMPSASQLGTDAAGGALFSGSWIPAGHANGHADPTIDPNPEPSDARQPIAQIADARRFFGQENGGPIVDINADVQPDLNRQITNPAQPLALPPGETKIPTDYTSNPAVAQEVIQRVIDKGATKAVAVQRIFPEANLSIVDAQSILDKANATRNRIEPTTGQPVIPVAGVDEPTIEKGIRVEAHDHPEVAAQDPNLLPQIARDELNIDKGAYDHDEDPLSEKEKQDGGPTFMSPTANQVPIPRTEADQSTGQHIGTVKDLLTPIADDPTHELSGLAQAVKDTADSIGQNTDVKIGGTADKEGNVRSYYSDKGNGTIFMTKEDIANPAKFVKTLFHETSHAIIAKKLPADLVGLGGSDLKVALDKHLANPNLAPDVREALQCYRDTVRLAGHDDNVFKQHKDETTGKMFSPTPDDVEDKTGWYGLSNPHEFFAEALSSHKFQNKLNNMDSGIHDGRSMWSRFKDAVAGMLGVKAKDGSMLERALKANEDLFRKEREGAMTVYHGTKTQPGLGQRSGYYPGSYHATTEQGAKEFGDNVSSRKVNPEKLFTVTDSDKLKQEAKQAGFGYHSGNGQAEVEYLKSKGFEGMRRGNEVILFDKEAEPILDNKHYASKKTDIEEEEPHRAGKIERMTQPLIDRVKELGPRYKAFGDAAKSAMNDEQFLRGHYQAAVIEAGKGMSKGDMGHVNDIMTKELVSKSLHPEMLENDAQKKFYTTTKRLMEESGQEHIARNIPINDHGTLRIMEQKPYHWPSMPNQKIQDTVRDNTDPKAIKDITDRLEEFNTKDLGMSPGEAKDDVKNWVASLQGTLRSSNMSDQTYQNALRRSEGMPLPPEFRERNPVKNMARYFDRMSKSMAFYKNIESNPKIMASLGADKTPWGKDIAPDPEGSITGNQAVKDLLNQFRGEHKSPAEQDESHWSGLSTGLFISGPTREVHILVSNSVKAISFSDNPHQMLNAITYALSHVKEGYIHAKEGGVVRMSATSVGDMTDGALRGVERLNGLSKIIRDISTFGGLTTKLNAGLMQAFFENMIPSKINRANAGDVTCQAFLRNLDPTYKKGMTYDTKGQQQLASLATQYTHGTGDARSMPAWMLRDSEVSGFFKLAHWSIAQTNNFYKDVMAPAQRGNYTPLITSVFGSLIGGYIIKDIREQLTGKRNQIPCLSEIAASERGLTGNTGLVGYNAIAAMQYSGFGGLLSQVAKYPFDFVYKNNPQGATFPLDEMVSDIGGTIHDVSTALANDPNVNFVDLASTVAQHLFTSNIQLVRIAVNQGINSGLITGLPAEKKQLSDKMGQLRRFDMVSNLPYNEIDEAGNPYINIEQKRFKLNQDIPSAIPQAMDLTKNIIATYGDRPDVMLQKLKALKSNRYATMPSMENTPISFAKYLTYLKNQEGPDAANQALQDYMKHKMVNEVKSSMVP